jgi:hypothetical protein
MNIFFPFTCQEKFGSCTCMLRVTQMDLSRASRVVNQPVMSTLIGTLMLDSRVMDLRRV